MEPVFAHVAGIPVEELVPFAYGAGAAWLALRARLWHLRRRPRRRS